MRLTRILAIALALATMPVFANQHFNQAKGFNANNVYQVNDYDSINAFNGNLNISIPIGNSYPIAEGAALQLMLHSNANVWDSEEYLGGDCTAEPGNVAYAHRRANAGMGWILSLGRLFAPGHPTNDFGWTYEAPDGAEHVFGGDAGWSDTGDESYLRMYSAGDVKTIEFPDGTKHYFSPHPQDGTLWRLDRVTRRVGVGIGNEFTLYSIAYPPGDDTWTITDAHLRTYVLTFKAMLYDGNADHRMIDSVTFPDGARYTFEYSSASLGRQLDMHTLKKSCMSTRANVFMLSSVARPDSSRFSFDYYRSTFGSGPVGLPTKMTVPTGGVVEWGWHHYSKPEHSAEASYERYSWGVHKRLVHPRGSTSTQAWTYDIFADDDADPNNYDDPHWTTAYQRTTITDPFGKVTESYFDVAMGPVSLQAGHHYGRPYTSIFKLDPTSTLWLSQKVFAKDPPTAANPNPVLQLRQTIYVEYDDDYPLSEPAVGGRLKKRHVVHNDDGGLVTTTTFDDYAGYGLYRLSTVTGSALGGSHVRLKPTTHGILTACPILGGSRSRRAAPGSLDSMISL